MIHLLNPQAEWAMCGAKGPDVIIGTVPTCLFCATGKWGATDNQIIRIIERNSVKDIERAIDAQLVEDMVAYVALDGDT